MARTAPWRSRARRLGLGGVILACLAAPAGAAVMDVAPDGRVTVIDGPVVQLSSDPASARRIGPPVRTTPLPASARPAAAPAGQLAQAISSAAERQHLDPSLIAAVAWQESRFRPDAVSPKGAVGVMQLMPGTARSLGVERTDLDSNVHGGAAYLNQLLARYDGDLVKALAAYNAGPAAVDRHGGPPPYPETRAYVAAVLERLAQSVVPLQPSARIRP